MTVFNRSDRHNTRLGPPLCGQKQHDAARHVIETLAHAGMLAPIPGWDGSLAEGYADILGINAEKETS